MTEQAASSEQKFFSEKNRKLLMTIVLMWAATRLLLFAVGLSAPSWVGYSTTNEEKNLSLYKTNIAALDIWTRWDAQWYLYLAEYGYNDDHLPEHYIIYRDKEFAMPYWPMYPLLMFVVSVVARNLALSGIIVSNIALILFLWALAQIYELKGRDGPGKNRVILYYLLFPTSFFLSAVYSESIFLAFCAWSILMALKGRWWIAGIIAGFATGCRPVGFALAPALGILYLQQIEFSIRDLKTLRNLDIKVLAPFLSILGFGGFMLFCWIHYGDPLYFSRLQEDWRRSDSGFFGAVVQFFRSGPALRAYYSSWIDFGLAAFAIFTLPLIYLRYGLALSLFSFIVILLPLNFGFMSFARYFLASFPHFMLLADFGKDRFVDTFLIAFFAGFLAIFFATFSLWGWIA